MRDPLYWPRKVQRLDERTFCCERQSDGVFPAATYLRTNPDGRALLAEIRWTGSTAEGHKKAQQLWKELSDSVDFTDSIDSSALVAAGTQIVEKLTQPAAAPIEPSAPSERWQWYRESSSKTSWRKLDYATEGYWIKGKETGTSPEGGEADWKFSRSRMLVYERIAKTEAQPPASQQTTRIEGEAKTIFSKGSFSLPPVTQTAELFIPGPALALVAGNWKGGAMMIRTDSLPWPSGWASPALVNLVIEPAFDLPKHEDGEAQAMLCWSIEVDGSGEAMRWYFDKNRRLQSIAFSGGVNLVRVEDEGETTRVWQDR
jgi:hypothetical protein